MVALPYHVSLELKISLQHLAYGFSDDVQKLSDGV